MQYAAVMTLKFQLRNHQINVSQALEQYQLSVTDPESVSNW